MQFAKIREIMYDDDIAWLQKKPESKIFNHFILKFSKYYYHECFDCFVCYTEGIISKQASTTTYDDGFSLR